MKTKYPECEKMKAVQTESQTIGQFLEWLGSRGIHLASYEEYEMLQPIRENSNKLLAKYFDIDLAKVEKEQRQILKSLNVKP